jgi:hypothetical protein
MFSIASQKDMQMAENENPQTEPKALSPAAQRALREAEERRNKQQALELAPELGGRGGAEPVRFGDYEIKGRAIDF